MKVVNLFQNNYITNQSVEIIDKIDRFIDRLEFQNPYLEFKYEIYEVMKFKYKYKIYV